METELIINQAAGGGKPKKYISEIKKYFDSINFKYRLSWTPSSGSAPDMARQAAQRGAKTVVSVGGDGTINEIINGIMQSKKQTALGIIPAGWANDFIKSTTIPRDLLEACKIIPDKKIKLIDVGLLNGQTYFANVCGIGFDADIAALANKMKTKHPNWKTLSAYVYVFATIQKLLSPIPFFQARISLDGQTIEGEMLLVAIANGRIEGGKFNIAPMAEIDDGLLDICIIRKMNRLRCLYLLPKAIKGTHHEILEVSFYKSREILIETDKPVNAQVAGELLPAEKNYHIEILPQKLSLIVP